MFKLEQFQRFSKRVWRALHHGKRVPVAISLLVTALVFAVFESPNPAIAGLRQRLDNVVYDQRFNMLTPSIRSSDPAIVIVDYDQKSLEREGQWPWSRFKLGQLVEQLAGYGVLVVGFDVFFPEYERNLAAELQSRIELDPAYAEIAAPLLP
jgi:adenylate cyclase